MTIDDLKRLGGYLTGVVLVAMTMRFIGYAAAVSYAAIFKLDDVDPRKIADHTQNTTGAFGLIVTLLLLTYQH